MLKRDAHIHTPYCPHGTKDSLENYIKKAINEGFEDITFTEHAPLPTNFVDPTPEKDSGMDPHNLLTYLDELNTLKAKYKDDIHIRIGFEVDYIVGYEVETTSFLNLVGPQIDDAILSVHFLKHDEKYTCIDYSDETFLSFAEQVGSVQAVYNLYYETLKKSIEANLGRYKPIRIGHPTLVHKFQLAHGEKIDDDRQIKEILQLMAEHNCELDVNSAGLAKKYCKESYPPLPYIQYAKELNVPLVFGSDAHQVSDLHQYYDAIFPIKD